MKLTINTKTNRLGFAARLISAAAFIGMAGILNVFAQPDGADTKVLEARSASVQPTVSDVRGVSIGMTVDEVKNKLGKPKMSDDRSMYYDFGDGESMQIALDADQKVRMAAMIYMGKKADAPEYAEIFGAGAVPVPAADGRIYHMVHYPDSGFWLAYNYMMTGDDPMTAITIQAIN